MKKYTAFSFLFVACAILLAHGMVPHHHHDSKYDLAAHHHSHHSHDGEEESNDLGHLFSHFIHSADDFTVTLKHNFSNTFSKQIISFVAVLSDNFSLREILNPPLLYKPPAEYLAYSSPHSLSSGLRAPPAFIS